MNSRPEPITRIAEIMSTFRPWWALCGGWAVDAWLSRQTRDHLDVDIAILHDDQRAIFDHLPGWELIAHDRHVADDSAEPWDGRPLDVPAHVHGREHDVRRRRPERLSAPAQAGFALDFQLSESSGNELLASRDPRVAVPLRRGVYASAWGVPTLVPEVVLFHKAMESRLHDGADFSELLPHLSQRKRDWLRHAIELALPGHAWLQRLAPEVGLDA